MLSTGRPYNDLKSNNNKSSGMATQTMNPYQQQSMQNNFGNPTQVPPKNGARRQGLWSAGNRNFMNGGRNGEQDIDPRLQVPDYPSALLDQNPMPMPDPSRHGGGGGLSRYHSAPSAFLQSLAADFQNDSTSSFFNADLPPLNSDSSMGDMETEQSSAALFDDKFLLDTRKFDRIGALQMGAGGGGGLVSQKSLSQTSYKPSMDVVLENTAVTTQMPSSVQMPSSIQMPSSGQMSQMPSSAPLMSSSQIPTSVPPSSFMPSNMGVVQQQQQISNSQGGQQMHPLANLTGNVNFSTGLGSEFISNGPALGGFQNTGMQNNGLQNNGMQNNLRPNNSLLRQSSSPAGLLAQLTLDVQQGQVAKSEKQSLSSPRANSPEESLSTSDENIGNGMMQGVDVAGWEDANSYMNWGNDSFSARKRFRDLDVGDMMMPSETSVSALSLPPQTLSRQLGVDCFYK
jgi:hypothetical protein